LKKVVLYFHKYGKFVLGQWIWTLNGGKHRMEEISHRESRGL